MGCLMTWFSKYIPNQVVDMIIRDQKLRAKNSYKSRIYKSCNYGENKKGVIME